MSNEWILANSCWDRAGKIDRMLCAFDPSREQTHQLDQIEDQIERLQSEFILLRRAYLEQDQAARLARITERAARSHPRITP